MAPKISIIIPAYNEEKNITRCLDSVLNQTFTDFEAICIDDRSTDSTFEILKNYSEKDSRIVPLKNTGKGVSSARNFGIDNANGNYIGFVDSDDFIQPQMFEFLYKAASENDADMSVCKSIKTGKFEEKFFNYSAEKCKCDDFINITEKEEARSYETLVSLWTKLVKKEVIKKSGYLENYKIGEDMIYCAKLWTNSEKVFLVNLPLYNYFINPNSATHVDLSSLKWFDYTKSYFATYDIFSASQNKKMSDYFLNEAMRYLLNYRFFVKNTPNEKECIDTLNNLYKKYIKFYRKNKSFSAFDKLYITFAYNFPKLYEIYRKKMDKTLN